LCVQASKQHSAFRFLTNIDRNATVVSLYQAGNGIHELFDKVTVIAEGRVLFYGPRRDARPYFEEMGFEHLDGANTADYLTAVTATNERKIKKGMEGKVPTTPAEFAGRYAKSSIAQKMRKGLDDIWQMKRACTNAPNLRRLLFSCRWASGPQRAALRKWITGHRSELP
jgi:ATP-binding cassette subfamily G (WHITE) protein 2 (SNQ2)